MITIVATWFAHETYKTEVDEDKPEEHELVRERRFVRDQEPARTR